MKFTRIPESAFKELVLNAGYLATTFDPTSGTAPEESALLGATTGGINFTAVPSFTDFGEDIDNCPKNMKELKQIESWEVKCSGTYVSASPANVKSMLGAAEWCCTIKVDIENSKGQYIEKDKQEATKDGSESTKIQHGI